MDVEISVLTPLYVRNRLRVAGHAIGGMKLISAGGQRGVARCSSARSVKIGGVLNGYLSW